MEILKKDSHNQQTDEIIDLPLDYESQQCIAVVWDSEEGNQWYIGFFIKTNR